MLVRGRVQDVILTAGTSSDAMDWIAVRGRLHPAPRMGGRVRFLAAAPPDRRASFAGSGLPFPSASAAFQDTPSSGTALTDVTGAFDIRLRMPGAYQERCGTVFVPPALHLSWTTAQGSRARATVQLGTEAVPYRSLSWPHARLTLGADFYNTSPTPDVRTQEAVLNASQHPGRTRRPLPAAARSPADDFWRSRPPR